MELNCDILVSKGLFCPTVVRCSGLWSLAEVRLRWSESLHPISVFLLSDWGCWIFIHHITRAAPHFRVEMKFYVWDHTLSDSTRKMKMKRELPLKELKRLCNFDFGTDLLYNKITTEIANRWHQDITGTLKCLLSFNIIRWRHCSMM